MVMSLRETFKSPGVKARWIAIYKNRPMTVHVSKESAMNQLLLEDNPAIRVADPRGVTRVTLDEHRAFVYHTYEPSEEELKTIAEEFTKFT